MYSIRNCRADLVWRCFVAVLRVVTVVADEDLASGPV